MHYMYVPILVRSREVKKVKGNEKGQGRCSMYLNPQKSHHPLKVRKQCEESKACARYRYKGNGL